jgi:hypothetical protein
VLGAVTGKVKVTVVPGTTSTGTGIKLGPQFVLLVGRIEVSPTVLVDQISLPMFFKVMEAL